MQPPPLPPELAASSFHVTDARAVGLTESRLRGADLTHPYRAVRGTSIPDTLLGRCGDLVPLLGPLQVISHITAARLHGFPLPYPRADEPLHVSSVPPVREPRVSGVIGHRMLLRPDQLTLLHGIPVTTAAETWAQLGGLLCPFGCARPHPVDDRPSVRARSRMLHLDDLIVSADHIAAAGAVDLEELAEAAAVPRRRGSASLKTALEYVRLGVESPKETETRLVIVRAGFPEPEINWVLRTATGAFIARLDLAYPQLRIAVEYDGRQHATTEQFRRDADRWAAIEAEGWILIRVLAHHLDDPGRLILPRIRRAVASRAG